MWCRLTFIVVLLHTAIAKPEKPADFAALKRLTERYFHTRFTLGRAHRPGGPSNTWECDNVIPVPSSVRSQMNLSSFYRKYLHAFGIPIISSNSPSDAALRRACYVVVFLLADRKDVRQWLYRRNGRAGVVGIREGVTSIPEHSWLPSGWNQRARGLGGTITHPISTCGEENLLCASSGDRYPREDIFLHEFTHGIHEIALVKGGAISDFDNRLNPRYRYLRSSGALWARTYAMSTDREYFAEGTQSYFDVNDWANPPNGIHNHVNTRVELKNYDPVLYQFNKEVFPCGNKIVKRCEAKQGNLPKERWYFKMDCDKDGNGILMDFKTKMPVGGGPQTPPPTPPPNTDAPPTPPPNTDAPPTPPPNTDAPPTPPPNTDAPPTPPPNTDAPSTPPPNTDAPPTPPPNTDAPPTPPPNTDAPPTPPPNTDAPPTPPPNTDAPPTPPPNTDAPPTPPPNTDAPPTPPPNTGVPTPPTPPPPSTPPIPPTPPPNTPAPPTPPPNTPAPPTNPPVNCRDNNGSCSYWARMGECNRNPGYMHIYCKKSCNKCDGGGGNCVDNNSSCSPWANSGECQRNPGYMLVYCKKSCKLC